MNMIASEFSGKKTKHKSFMVWRYFAFVCFVHAYSEEVDLLLATIKTQQTQFVSGFQAARMDYLRLTPVVAFCLHSIPLWHLVSHYSREITTADEEKRPM